MNEVTSPCGIVSTPGASGEGTSPPAAAGTTTGTSTCDASTSPCGVSGAVDSGFVGAITGSVGETGAVGISVFSGAVSAAGVSSPSCGGNGAATGAEGGTGKEVIYILTKSPVSPATGLIFPLQLKLKYPPKAVTI